MDSNIIGKPHLQYVQDQIRVRQEILGKNSKSTADIAWTNARTSWVRLVSSVDIRDENIAIYNMSSSEWEVVPNNGAEFRSKYLELPEYSGNELSNQIVLQGGTLNANGTQKFGVSETNNIFPSNGSSYGLGGTEFGLQPMPGIISFDSKTNNKGSLRFATLQIRANNKKQFEYIEAAYLRLGYTMLLEWGNSSYPYTDPATNVTTYETNRYSLVREFLDNPPTGANGTKHFYTQIENYRRKSYGNYDGFLGRVENFSWEFTKEGYYLITLKLITIGSVIESLRINVIQNRLTGVSSTNKKDPKTKDQKVNSLLKIVHLSTEPIPENKKRDDSWFTGIFDPLNPVANVSTAILSWVFDATTTTTYSFKPIKSDYSVLSLNDKVTEDQLKEASTEAYACAALFGDTHFGKFLRFKELLRILNSFFLIYGGEDKDPVLFELDTSEQQYCFSSTSNISSDPTKLIVRFKGNILGQNIEIFAEDGRQIPEFHSQVDGVDVGIIPNIFFSYDLLESLILTNTDEETGALDLYKFLKSLLNEANILLGGVNKLNLRIVDKNFGTEEEPIIKQVVEFYDEVSPFEVEKLRKAKEEEPSFKIYGFGEEINGQREGNFVLDYQFRTEITKKLSTMIAVGAQANGQSVGEDATLFSKWNYGLVDRVLPQKLDIDKVIKKADETTQGYLQLISLYQDYLENFTGAINSGSITFEENNVDTLPGWIGGAQIDQIENVTGYKFPNCNLTPLNDYQTSLSGFTETQRTVFNKFYSLEAVGRKLPTPFIGFVPIGFEMTIDGLSGLRIFDRLKIDSRYLPPNYGDTLDFIITQLDHKIENNKWITHLATMSIPKLFGNKLSIDFEYLLSQLPAITTGFEDLVGWYSYNASALATLISQTMLYIADNPGLGTGDTIRLNTNGNLNLPHQKDTLPIVAGGDGFQQSPLISIGQIKGNTTANVSFVLRNATTATGLEANTTKAFKLYNQQTNKDYYNGHYYLAEPAAEALLEFGKFLEENYPNKTYLITSAYRSYNHQEGLKSKDSSSKTASAGSSPHGWGGAVDINELIARDQNGELTSNPNINQAFRTTNEDYKIWAEHAPKFGWYNPLRLRDGKGVDESWHWEFWGKPGQTLRVASPYDKSRTSGFRRIEWIINDLTNTAYTTTTVPSDRNALNAAGIDGSYAKKNLYIDEETGKIIQETLN